MVWKIVKRKFNTIHSDRVQDLCSIIPSVHLRAKILAIYVSDVMVAHFRASNFSYLNQGGSSSQLPNSQMHETETLEVGSKKLGNYRCGNHRQRALMYKCFAELLNVACSLHRTKKGTSSNTTTSPHHTDDENLFVYWIQLTTGELIDLWQMSGEMYLDNSEEVS